MGKETKVGYYHPVKQLELLANSDQYYSGAEIPVVKPGSMGEKMIQQSLRVQNKAFKSLYDEGLKQFRILANKDGVVEYEGGYYKVVPNPTKGEWDRVVPCGPNGETHPGEEGSEEITSEEITSEEITSEEITSEEIQDPAE